MGRKLAAFVLLGLVTPVYLFYGHSNWLNVYDEGITVYGAMRVLGGELPYRDFWSVYPPGQYYLLAGLFSLFGPTLLVERTATFMASWGLVGVAYALARRLVGWGEALWTWLGMLLWVGSLRLYASPVPPALVLALCAFLLTSLFFARSRMVFLLGSGLLTGLMTLFRHDLGFFCFFAHALALAAACRLQKDALALPRFRPALAVYLAGLALVLVPAAIVLLSYVPAGEVYSQLIHFPLKVVQGYGGLPFPSLFADPLMHFQFYCPLLILTAGLGLLSSRARSGQWQDDDSTALLLVLMGWTCFRYLLSRTHATHLLPMLVPSLALLPWLIRGRSFWVAPAALALVLTAWEPLHLKAEVLRATPARAGLVPLALPRARGLFLPASQAASYEQAVRAVQACAPAGEKIFVANARHDRFMIGDIIFYFLSERDSATKYYVLAAGLANTREVQHKIISDLIRHQVRCVVLWTFDSHSREPNLSGVSSGVTDLDDFLRRYFPPAAQFGPHILLRRQGELPPLPEGT